MELNGHYTWGGVYITDLCIRLGGRLYHVECQSNPDGRMIIRNMEYVSFIALKNAHENEDGSYTMDFPDSCVIYLRSTKNTPDKLTMNIRFSNGQSVVFDAPLIKMADYSMDQLFEKNLLMLLPYYLMRYEEDCKAAGELEDEEEADQRMEAFMDECEGLLKKLSDACTEKEQQYTFQTLADLIIEVAMYLAPENRREKVKAMGGTVIRTRAQVLREEGESIGEARGELKKAQETALTLTEMGMAPEKIAKAVKYNVDTVRQWIEAGMAVAK